MEWVTVVQMTALSKINNSIRKQTSMLIRINAKSETDELELISFALKTEEFFTKTMRIFRYFKSSEIRYIIHSFLSNEIERMIIYLLVNTGENYFFSLDYYDGKITELNISNDVDMLPSFQKLNSNFFITIGGASGNNASVNLYEINTNKWYNVGNLNSPRNGAYALINNEENTVFICGGSNNDGDNTFDIEYFSLVYPIGEQKLNLTYYPCEIKSLKIKNDFLVRKTNPLIIPLSEDNSYLICGGSNIFQETNTCTVFYTDRELIFLSNTQTPQAFSTNSQNYFLYKNSAYFFISDNEVVRYSLLDNQFEVIKKELIEV